MQAIAIHRPRTTCAADCGNGRAGLIGHARSSNHQQLRLPSEGVVLQVGVRGDVMLAPLAPTDSLAPGRGVRIVRSGDGVCLWSSLPLQGGDRLPGSKPQGAFFDLPLRFQLGTTAVEMVETRRVVRGRPRLLDREATSSEEETKWCRALEALAQWEVSPQEAFHSATDSMVDAAGLDGAYALTRDLGGAWRVLAARLKRPEQGVWLDEELLAHGDHYSGEVLLHPKLGAAAASVIVPRNWGGSDRPGALVGIHRAVANGDEIGLEAAIRVKAIADSLETCLERLRSSTVKAHRHALIDQVMNAELALA